jgi:hypothetical protein
MKTNETPHPRPPLRRRQRYDWPPEAERLARRKPRIHPSRLVEQLQEMTDYPRDACWRFAQKFGVERPTHYRSWPTHDQAKVLEMSETRSITEIAKHFGVSIKAIYHVLAKNQRQVSRRSEWFGLHMVARLLTVKPGKVLNWVICGKLHAIVEQHGQITYTMVSGADLVKFCKEHMDELLRQRIPEKRILFLTDYVVAGDVADTYKARSAKLERKAVERGEYLKPDSGEKSADKSAGKERGEED